MSSMQVPANSVWSSMNYTPPRGSCNFKNGIMSGTCPCLRFMLHPVKAATSFECDGCGHHASYHNLDNPAEDAIRAKWSAQEQALTPMPQQASTSSSKKRRRITSQPQHERVVNIADDSSETTEGAVESVRSTGGLTSLFSNRSLGDK